MSGALLLASGRAVLRAPVLVPALAAATLVAAMLPWLDDGWAFQVLAGAAVLVACAATGAADDPMGEVAMASPFPHRVRAAHRYAAVAALVVPLMAGAALVTEARAPQAFLVPPLAGATALVAVGLATGAVVRVRRGVLLPAYLASVGVIAAGLTAWSLEGRWALFAAQPWGPPLEASLYRWAAVALACVGLLGWALRDPATRTPA